MTGSGDPVDLIPLAAVRLAPDGGVARANQRWGVLLGTDVPGGDLGAWFPEEADLAARLRAASGHPEGLRLHARRADAVPITVCVDVGPGPAPGELICTAREISGADLLSESQRYLDVAFSVAPIGMAIFDTQGRYLRVNAALTALLGREEAELLGRRDQEFTHPDDRQGEVDAAWRILNGELDTWQTEKRFLLPSGEVVWAIANLAFLRDEGGRPLCWLGQFQDITARRAREDRLGHDAVHDELTGVANRRGLTAELAERISHAQRYDEPGALLVLDLDGFKEINDREGHQAGDDLLSRAAGTLRTRLRTTDFVARLGGDEFAVILPHADPGAARQVADAVLEAIRELAPGVLSASCGIAVYDGSVGDAEALLGAADSAMYQAKAQGRDRVCVVQAPVRS